MGKLLKDYYLRRGKDYIYCEICNKKFQSLPTHLLRVHKISAWEYKEEMGLKKSQPLECEELTERRRQSNEDNKEVVRKNLTNEYSFKKGHKGHKDRELSVQAKEIFTKNLHDNMTKESHKRTGLIGLER